MTKNIKPKIRAAFPGCATIIAEEAGVLQFLQETFDIEEYVGTSAGAGIASAGAVGLSGFEVKEILSKRPFSDYADWSLVPWKRWGLIKGDIIYNMLRETFPRKLGSTKTPVSIITLDELTRREIIFSSELTPEMPIADAVRGSMAIQFLIKEHHYSFEILSRGKSGATYVKTNAGYIEPTFTRKKYKYVLSDGGVVRNNPVDLWGKRENVIGMLVTGIHKGRVHSPWYMKPFKPFANKVFGVVNAMLDANDKEHLEDAHWPNIIQVRSKYDGLSFSHTKEDIDDMFMHGYECAKAWYETSKYNSGKNK